LDRTLATTVKNTLRSYATASVEFGRSRAATNSSYPSTRRWPSRGAALEPSSGSHRCGIDDDRGCSDRARPTIVTNGRSGLGITDISTPLEPVITPPRARSSNLEEGDRWKAG
jgi:hypothetical protein